MAERSDRPTGYLSLVEAAERLGLHPNSVLRLIRQEKIRLTPYARPAYRTCRKFWFKAGEVGAAAAARQTLRS